VVIASLAIDGVPIVLASVHMTWCGNHPAGTLGAVADAVALADLLHEMPHTAIVGDINDAPGGPILGALVHRAYDAVTQSGATAVFHDAGSMQVDHILTRGMTGIERPTGFLADEPLPTPAFPSDHVPIAATIRWPLAPSL